MGEDASDQFLMWEYAAADKDRKTQGWKPQGERDANRNVVDSDLQNTGSSPKIGILV